jgi:hypothetical protein
MIRLYQQFAIIPDSTYLTGEALAQRQLWNGCVISLLMIKLKKLKLNTAPATWN